MTVSTVNLTKFRRSCQVFKQKNLTCLDANVRKGTLVQRVYQQYGYRDLLIKQVWLEEPHLSVAGVFHSVGEE